ncbi:LuxR C-terminal-related transcriptional regulator [Streptomyces sp. NPDC012450]|uniref:LuxR C-terminal-related transcriptional regulator n=3 Tax=unclassified Streptomyces TaxID=2593676 RepID=UPI0036F0E61E
MVAFDRQVALPPDGEVREDIGPAVLTVVSQGLRDETIARRLGVSLRTCRKYIADLFDLLGAESRFQAGYLTRAGNLLENTGDTPPGGIGE